MLDILLEEINKHGGVQYYESKNKDGKIVSRGTIIPQVIVTLENFFDGTPDPNYTNFAANAATACFGDSEFYELFKSFREKDEVQDVWIELTEYDPNEYEYPYSEVCYISTTANEDEIMQWFGDVAFPSEISICEDVKQEGLPAINEGYTLFHCWWD